MLHWLLRLLVGHFGDEVLLEQELLVVVFVLLRYTFWLLYGYTLRFQMFTLMPVGFLWRLERSIQISLLLPVSWLR